MTAPKASSPSCPHVQTVVATDGPQQVVWEDQVYLAGDTVTDALNGTADYWIASGRAEEATAKTPPKGANK